MQNTKEKLSELKKSSLTKAAENSRAYYSVVNEELNELFETSSLRSRNTIEVVGGSPVPVMGMY